MGDQTKRALVETEERYQIKCRKYPAEVLDEEFRNLLWEEAYREAFAAATINAGLVS